MRKKLNKNYNEKMLEIKNDGPFKKVKITYAHTLNRVLKVLKRIK